MSGAVGFSQSLWLETSGPRHGNIDPLKTQQQEIDCPLLHPTISTRLENPTKTQALQLSPPRFSCRDAMIEAEVASPE